MARNDPFPETGELQDILREESELPSYGPAEEPHLYSVAAGARSEHLQDLLAGSTDVHEFLSDLAKLTARKLSESGNPISCGVTVIRRKRPIAVANNDARARKLDDLQNSCGDGPCLTALRERTATHVHDVRHDTRWPEYLRLAAIHDVGSILAVPIDVKSAGEAVLNLYSPNADGFSRSGIQAAEAVAGEASRALGLALKIARLSEHRDNLNAALESRTTIATAVGIIMAENRCTGKQAFQILVSASSHRNIKIRRLAQIVIDRVAGVGEPAPAFEP